MKAQIIQLESQDTLISIRDKMSWAKTPDILLAWPRHGRVRLNLLDLKLLQRQASAANSRLGLVTRERDLALLARNLGIPVFASLAEANRLDWDAPPPGRPSRRSRRPDLRLRRPAPARLFDGWQARLPVRLAFFTLGAMAVLALAAVFLPSAEIALQPRSETQAMVIPFSAAAYGASVSSNQVRVGQMTLTLEGSGSQASTGQVTLPQEHAAGTARFRNLGESPVSIPAGTILQTPGLIPVQFSVQQAGEVPGGFGREADLPIRAVNPGPAGNLEAGSLVALQGSLGLLLTATNPDPTGGGTGALRAPSTVDRAGLQALVMAGLEEGALERFASMLADGDLLLPHTLRLNGEPVVSYSIAEGQAGDMLALDLAVSFTIEYALAESIQELSREILDAALQIGYEPAEAGMTFQVITAPADMAGSSAWEMSVARQVRPQVDTPAAFQAIQGRPAGEAGSILAGLLPLAQDPQVRMSPAWWPWIPLTPLRVDFLVLP